MSRAVANELRLPINKTERILLVTASGEKMEVDGQVDIYAHSQGTITYFDAIVSPHMHEDMLVSWYNLQTMGRIPAGFPNTICGPPRHVALQTTAEKGKAGNSNAAKEAEPNSYEHLRNKLIQTFPDVLSDELSPIPMKTDVPMHITLKKLSLIHI